MRRKYLIYGVVLLTVASLWLWGLLSITPVPAPPMSKVATAQSFLRGKPKLFKTPVPTVYDDPISLPPLTIEPYIPEKGEGSGR